MFYDIRITCQENQELMHWGLFIISLSGESGGPGFFKDDTDRNNFPDLIGAAGKETKPDGGGLCLLKVDIQAD